MHRLNVTTPFHEGLSVQYRPSFRLPCASFAAVAWRPAEAEAVVAEAAHGTEPRPEAVRSPQNRCPKRCARHSSTRPGTNIKHVFS